MIIKSLLFSIIVFLAGCQSSIPVDMSSYSKPAPGYSGIYFYQNGWPTPQWYCIEYVLDGEVMGCISNKEWIYLEVSAGEHVYREHGGLFPSFKKFQFIEGQNYFFLGQKQSFHDLVSWMNFDWEIDRVVGVMKDGSYKEVKSVK